MSCKLLLMNGRLSLENLDRNLQEIEDTINRGKIDEIIPKPKATPTVFSGGTPEGHLYYDPDDKTWKYWDGTQYIQLVGGTATSVTPPGLIFTNYLYKPGISGGQTINAVTTTETIVKILSSSSHSGSLFLVSNTSNDQFIVAPGVVTCGGNLTVLGDLQLGTSSSFTRLATQRTSVEARINITAPSGGNESRLYLRDVGTNKTLVELVGRVVIARPTGQPVTDDSFKIVPVSSQTGYTFICVNPSGFGVVAVEKDGGLIGSPLKIASTTPVSTSTLLSHAYAAGGASYTLIWPANQGIAGQSIRHTATPGTLEWFTPAAGGTGTVTSVDLAVPAEFTLLGNPITTSGTITIAKATQAANLIYAGPASGGVAVPTFRLLDPLDIPDLSATYQPFDADLAAIAAFSGGVVGFSVRTAADTWALRTLQAPAAGLSIINPTGIAGDPTFALTNDLGGLEGLSGTGLARRTGVDAWTLDTSTYLTGNQTITLTGDVSGSGATYITTVIGANKVTLGMLAQLSANKLLGRDVGTGNVEALTVGTGLTFSGGPGSSLELAAFTGGDVTKPTGSVVLTLASIITAGGPTGSATVAPIITWDAKGRLTVVSSATITPAVGSITGLGTGVATFLATPSSANLLAAVTNETGSGALVFATSPTLVTPLLGTPTSGVLTNCTGLPIVAGTAGTLSVDRGGTGATSFTAGAILFGNGTSPVAIDASNLFWDNSNDRLGIKTSSPLAPLHVVQVASGAYPTLGTSLGGVFLASDNSAYGLYIGSSFNDGNSWMQVMRNDSAVAYNLILQPSGGNVGINTSVADYDLTLKTAGTGAYGEGLRIVSGASSSVYSTNVYGNTWYFLKPTGDVNTGNNHLFAFEPCGEIDANSGFWNGLNIGGHYITESAAAKYPRLAIYSRSGLAADPTDYEFVFAAGNAGNLPVNVTFGCGTTSAPGRPDVLTSVVRFGTGTPPFYTPRRISGIMKVLADNTLTNLFTCVIADTSLIAGCFEYCISVENGTDIQTRIGTVSYYATKKGGAAATNLTTNDFDSFTLATTGTGLTTANVTFGMTQSGNTVTINCTANTDLTGTITMRISYELRNLTTQAITIV